VQGVALVQFLVRSLQRITEFRDAPGWYNGVEVGIQCDQFNSSVIDYRHSTDIDQE
jgi:hypothetical protein